MDNKTSWMHTIRVFVILLVGYGWSEVMTRYDLNPVSVFGVGLMVGAVAVLFYILLEPGEPV